MGKIVNKQLPPPWLKSKSYIHITPNIDVKARQTELLQKIENPQFIRKYAFFPLIHSVIKDRKYKEKYGKRCHKYNEDGKTKSTAKERPLHYSTHFDSLIYGYYGSLIQENYEKTIKNYNGLSECITAYRQIKIDSNNINGKNKGTIHFANDVFEEIRNQYHKKGEIAVLAFDIEKFFPSLNHEILRKSWEFMMDYKELPKDHYNVFKASTQFSYINLDNFRINQNKSGKKSGFNEKKIAEIRKKNGHTCFFESIKEFRESIKSGAIKVCKYPFRHPDTNIPIGIPQGLPISAVLANIYLFNFDIQIFQQLVIKYGCYYRHYSDDIIIICDKTDIETVREFVENEMKKYELTISKDKTDVFLFRDIIYNNQGDSRLTSIKLKNGIESIGSPLVYLGFEFRGFNTLIKSSNLAKFYRKMIFTVKRRARRAKKIIQVDPLQKKAIYVNQIKRLYKNISLKTVKIHLRKKVFYVDERGEYKIKSEKKNIPFKSNYFSYVNRSSKIINDISIKNQLRKSRHILLTAIKRKLQ